MEIQSPIYYYPNLMGRIILLALDEIIGKNSVNALLKHAQLTDWLNEYPPHNHELKFSFNAVGKIQVSLEEIYGPRGGRGIALRAGRSCFLHGLREFGPLLGLTEMSFRIMPLPLKLQIGATAFAELFNKYSDQKVQIEATENQLLWHIDRCPVCWQRKSTEPVCYLAVGLLQEALHWISAGKIFKVEEIQCVANGFQRCTISIDKVPMG